ncbi:hypothetical protein [Chromobacterium haemolyticum]|nr:hypothetical protein [Chromobacterium haemolyticum]MDH0344051.1 hypothetical protein [Chromobacterium haemolyticum]
MNHERMALCVAGIGLMVLGWALSSSLLLSRGADLLCAAMKA